MLQLWPGCQNSDEEYCEVRRVHALVGLRSHSITKREESENSTHMGFVHRSRKDSSRLECRRILGFDSECLSVRSKCRPVDGQGHV